MTTKKSSKKKVSKKVDKKAAANAGPEAPTRENIKFFMGLLIQAGFVGKAIPESAPDQGAKAQELRQFAERLSNQLRKFD